MEFRSLGQAAAADMRDALRSQQAQQAAGDAIRRLAQEYDDMKVAAESHWNPSNPPPEPRYAERQPTTVQDLKASGALGTALVQEMLGKADADHQATLRRIADLLEQILVKLNDSP